MTMVYIIVSPLRPARTQVSDVEQSYLCRTSWKGVPSCWFVDSACATLQLLFDWTGGCQCKAANHELFFSCFAYCVTYNINRSDLQCQLPCMAGHPGFYGRFPVSKMPGGPSICSTSTKLFIISALRRLTKFHTVVECGLRWFYISRCA